MQTSYPLTKKAFRACARSTRSADTTRCPPHRGRTGNTLEACLAVALSLRPAQGNASRRGAHVLSTYTPHCHSDPVGWRQCGSSPNCPSYVHTTWPVPTRAVWEAPSHAATTRGTYGWMSAGQPRAPGRCTAMTAGSHPAGRGCLTQVPGSRFRSRGSPQAVRRAVSSSTRSVHGRAYGAAPL